MTTGIDYSELTQKERFDLISEYLNKHGYSIEFNLLRKEEFKPFYKNAKTNIVRHHYTAQIRNTNTKEVFDFPYFCPVKCYSDDPWHGCKALTPVEKKEVREQSRLVGFISCIVLDASFLESEDIKDSLDYMKAYDLEPNEARKQYAALRDAEYKLRKCFSQAHLNQLAAYTEGY